MPFASKTHARPTGTHVSVVTHLVVVVRVVITLAIMGVMVDFEDMYSSVLLTRTCPYFRIIVIMVILCIDEALMQSHGCRRPQIY